MGGVSSIQFFFGFLDFFNFAKPLNSYVCVCARIRVFAATYFAALYCTSSVCSTFADGADTRSNLHIIGG